MLRALLLVVLTLGPAIAAHAEEPRPSASAAVIRVVVMDLDRSADVPERVGRVVADNLVVELRKLSGVSVVGMDEVRAMLALESDRQLIGCTDDKSCLSELADALGADVVISGSIATIADDRVFSLRRIDQRAASVTGAVEERLVLAGGEELLAAIGPAIEKLFPDIGLKVGARRGVPPERPRLLNPPPLPTWATITVGAVAVGTFCVGGGGLASAHASQGAAQDLINASRSAPVDGGLIVKQEQSAADLQTIGVSLAVAGATVGVAAGVMAAFTDWSGAATHLDE